MAVKFTSVLLALLLLIGIKLSTCLPTQKYHGTNNLEQNSNSLPWDALFNRPNEPVAWQLPKKTFLPGIGTRANFGFVGGHQTSINNENKIAVSPGFGNVVSHSSSSSSVSGPNGQQIIHNSVSRGYYDSNGRYVVETTNNV